MKQRLGIAAALLPDPRLLILDEPTNGLDPAGIVEIRSLLRSLGRGGRTVVVSSHLMTEIEAACDFIVVIRFGELVFCGPISELMARTRAHIDLKPEHLYDLAGLSAALCAVGWQAAVLDEQVRVVATPDDAAPLNRAAASAGITLAGIAVAQDSLEDIFLAMTGTSDGSLAGSRTANETGAA